jgi:hypothetical protein
VVCGALVYFAALACALERAQPVARRVLWTAAAVLLLSLVVFRLPTPTYVGVPLEGPATQPFTVPYTDTIPSVWYMVPAAALALLAVGLELLPRRPRTRPTRPAGDEREEAVP